MDILDTSRLRFTGNFGEQVENLFLYIRLTRQDVEGLVHLFNDLLMALRWAWPGCRVVPFGSVVTGLGIKSSDIDIYVDTKSNHDPVDCVKIAKRLLNSYPNRFTDLVAITGAKVPIVKFLHIPLNCYTDLNFSSCSGVRNTELLLCLIQSDLRVLNLAILAKYWSKVHRLTGTHLMPNYALTLLVIFYLQQRGILPSVHYLQRDELQNIVANWNTAFNPSLIYLDNQKDNPNEFALGDSLYELTGGFFKYYAEFDFENNIVCPFLGRVVKKEEFADINNVPKEYVWYKINVKENIYNPLRLDKPMCVQDPFEHCRNCTVMVHPKLHEVIINQFKLAKVAYEERNDYEFLKKILIDNVQQNTPQKPLKKNKHNFNNKVLKNSPKAKNVKRKLEDKLRVWSNTKNKW